MFSSPGGKREGRKCFYYFPALIWQQGALTRVEKTLPSLPHAGFLGTGFPPQEAREGRKRRRGQEAFLLLPCCQSRALASTACARAAICFVIVFPQTLKRRLEYMRGGGGAGLQAACRPFSPNLLLSAFLCRLLFLNTPFCT